MHAARSRPRRAAGVIAAAFLVTGLSTSTSMSPAAAEAPVPGTISTWAGGTGEGPATNLAVRPDELASRGPLVYIADQRHHTVRVLDTRTGELRTVAGTGDPAIYLEQTPRGDGGLATASRIDTLTGVAVDGSGRVALSDSPDNRIRRVDGSGIITTIAGGGHPPDGDADGDGLQATEATIRGSSSLVYDQSGNLFAVDESLARVRKIATSGIISTVAGGRCFCTTAPEDAPAVGTAIKVNAVTVDATGHLYIATGFQVLRMDDAGILRRIVGTPESQLDRGDGGLATQATLRVPEALAFDGAGNLYIADAVDNRVRMVDTAGIITTIAGGGTPTDGLGDGGAATAASLSNPTGLTVGPAGELYVSDNNHFRVRKVLAGVISTAVGNGTLNVGGDGGPAAKSQFGAPRGMARDGAGNLYVADTGNERVRRIDPSGRVTTVAGTTWGFGGDGGPAVAAKLHRPEAVAVDRAGNLFISDSQNDRVRKVDSAGIITTVAGGGTVDLGDGGPATDVVLQEPSGLAVDGAGNLYIADMQHSRVRKVTLGGTISTIAGGGTPSAGVGDGGPATSAKLLFRTPGTASLAFDPLGQLHVSAQDRVRKIDLAGVITTVVGGACCGSGNAYEGTLAVKISLTEAGPIAFDAGGNLFYSEVIADAIMRVDLMGRIHHMAGSGSRKPLGDGGPATSGRIDGGGGGLSFDPAGNLYVSDYGADRLRRIESAGAVPNKVVSTGWNGLGQLGDGTTVDRHAVVATGSGLTNVRAVGAGYYHSLAVKVDGTVWTWGWNVYGQLGDGTTTDRTTPNRVPGLTNVVAVAGGAYHSLALKADGTVWAWGWNGLGQLGDGTTVDRLVPVRVTGLTGVKAIAAGSYHDLALTNDGTVWAWGWNYFGQLGTGSAAPSEPRPVPVPGSAGATSIAAGVAHSLSVRSVGGNIFVWSWGFNAYGQLGDGTTTERRAPVRSLAQGEEVFAGGYHSFTGGGPSSLAWGYNAYGQLGTGSTATFAATPATVNSPVPLDSIAPGLFHSVALAYDGTVLTWGWNGYGALGDGTQNMRATPTAIPGLTGAGGVAVGAVHTVIVK